MLGAPHLAHWSEMHTGMGLGMRLAHFERKKPPKMGKWGNVGTFNITL